MKNKTDQTEQEAFSAKEVAQLLGCHVATIRRAIDRGELKAARVGKLIRISKEDLNEYYQARGGGKLFQS